MQNTIKFLAALSIHSLLSYICGMYILSMVLNMSAWYGASIISLSLLLLTYSLLDVITFVIYVIYKTITFFIKKSKGSVFLNSVEFHRKFYAKPSSVFSFN